MKIKIEELNKIELKEDEMLWIKADQDLIKSLATVLNKMMPEALRKKVIVSDKTVELTKIKAGSGNGKCEKI